MFAHICTILTDQQQQVRNHIAIDKALARLTALLLEALDKLNSSASSASAIWTIMGLPCVHFKYSASFGGEAPKSPLVRL